MIDALCSGCRQITRAHGVFPDMLDMGCKPLVKLQVLMMFFQFIIFVGPVKYLCSTH